MLSLQATLALSSLFHLPSAQTISVNTDASDNEYLNTEVEWGTPAQTFSVLVDTTDHTSWVYDQSVNTPSPTMDTAASSTFSDLGNGELFSYQDQFTQIEFARDTFTIGHDTVPNIDFAVATQNFNITDDEGLSGFLSLDRNNPIIPALYNNGSIQNKTVSIDVLNQKLHLGPYTPSNYDNVSNATSCSNTTNADLSLLWVFDITLIIDDVPALTTNTFKGVIDAASPYITIYARDEFLFLQLYKLMDKTTGTVSSPAYHCNYTSRYCSSPDDIMNLMTIVVDQVSWNISIFQEDLISDDYVQIFYDGDTDYTTEHDTDYVLFLGRPFLKHVVVTMDYDAEALTFYSVSTSESSLNWVTIAIVFGCVAVFALLFFGVYYWKYGRIPPPSNSDAEEQSHSLLRGPVQAVGSSQQGVINPGQGVVSSAAPFSGPSGLDEDDEEYQRQLQQVQRQSAIEAQQRREQQMRVDREREEQRMMEEQKQQAQLQQAQSSQQQRIGGSAPKPTSADDLRQRRLQFLDSQKQLQQPDEDNDEII